MNISTISSAADTCPKSGSFDSRGCPEQPCWCPLGNRPDGPARSSHGPGYTDSRGFPALSDPCLKKKNGYKKKKTVYNKKKKINISRTKNIAVERKATDYDDEKRDGKKFV